MKKSFLAAVLTLAGMVGAGAAFAADKPAIGVAEFKNESGAAWWRGGVRGGAQGCQRAMDGRWRRAPRPYTRPVRSRRRRARPSLRPRTGVASVDGATAR